MESVVKNFKRAVINMFKCLKKKSKTSMRRYTKTILKIQ